MVLMLLCVSCVCVQSVFRGIQGRRIAEERAMMLTFLRAQDAAIERMTDKVRGEVRPP
jgi:DNA-binding FadR family transcriptional regulator